MKTPRVSDFDPNAEPSNDTTPLSSSMDHLPRIRTTKNHGETFERVDQEPKTEAVNSSPNTVRSSGRPVVRETTRYAFEFYRDQIRTLRQISLSDKLSGGKRTMSEMVREAIDRYLDGLGER